MKIYGRTCSIKSGTSEVISSTDCNWNKVKPQSLIRFGVDNDIFPILCAEQLFYIKDFEIINLNTIKIKEDVFPYITKDDLLEITYKEYQVSNNAIFNEGRNYKVDDLIFADGGVLAPANGEGACWRVVAVNEFGGILNIEQLFKGKYISFNEGENNVATTGNGSGAILHLAAEETQNRTLVTRQAHLVGYDNNTTVISFLQALPAGVKFGKVSVKKWKMTLGKTYYYELNNGKLLNSKYQIYDLFTPRLSFPLIQPGEQNVNAILNNWIMKIDEELHLLKTKENE